MNNARQEYTQQVRSLFSLCNAEPFLDGSTTPLQLAKDYAEVGEDCGLSLEEAVEIIERELVKYAEDKTEAINDSIVANVALSTTAKKQARFLLQIYKWTPEQRQILEQQAGLGYIVASHGKIAEVFGRMMPNNPYDIATYRIGWLGDKPIKRSLCFWC